MFLFWYYIHIPIKNIMYLRGMRKAKDFYKSATFRKKGDSLNLNLLGD